jgi:hypothetical protein
VSQNDPATGWFEIQQYDDKESITVANIIEQKWFKIPMANSSQRGNKIIGKDFQNDHRRPWI